MFETSDAVGPQRFRRGPASPFEHFLSVNEVEFHRASRAGVPQELTWPDWCLLTSDQKELADDLRIPRARIATLAAENGAYPEPEVAASIGDQSPDELVAMLDAATPGPALGAAIERCAAERDVLGGAGWEALLTATGRQIAHLHAVQYATLGAFMADIASRDLPANSPLQDIGRRQAQASLGAAMLLAPGTALRIVQDAEALTQRFPATLAALDAGTIDQHKARAITDELDFGHLTDEQRSGAEAALLDWAKDHTTRSTQARARRIIERLDPGEHERRHQDRLTERDVTHEDTGDGMGAIRWEDDALATRAFHTWLNDTARALGKSDPRSMKERRADIWRDILTALITGTPLPAGLTLPLALVRDMAASNEDKPTPDQADTDQTDTDQTDTGPADTGPADTGPADTVAPAANPFTGAAFGLPAPRSPDDPGTTDRLHDVARGVGARTTLVVHIDLPTFLQLRDGVTRITDGIAHLEGHGDLTVSQTTTVLAAATRIRFAAVDPETGTCLHLGAVQTYTPPQSMRDTVDDAHLVCRFPGCRRTARGCDCDHRQDHTQGGPTCPCNLGPICRTHHNLKTHGGWTVNPEDPRRPFGTMLWISPAGRKYLDRPEDPPLPPPPARTAPTMQNSDSDPPPY